MYQDNLRQTQEFYKKYIVNHVVKNGHFVVQNVRIKPAVCSNVHEELESLYDKRLELYHKYKILEDNILLGDKSERYKGLYNSVLKEIDDVQLMINNIHKYFEDIEEHNDTLQEMNKLREELVSLRKENNISLYVKKLIKLRQLEGKQVPMASECLVKEIPRVVDHVATKEKPIAKVVGKLSDEDKDTIKRSIKDLIKEKFKAKTLEECTSQKRSQPYYMKKEDIIQTIENTPQIKKVMPGNFKSLNKESLCKQLFDEKI